MSHTVRDLRALAESRGQRVPVLLALTIQVQTLRGLEERHREGRGPGRLEAGRVGLRAGSLGALLADPTRDPKVELDGPAGIPAATCRCEAEDLREVAAMTVELLTGAPPGAGGGFPSEDVPADVAGLLRRMLDPREARRPQLAEALAASREAALERLAAWDRGRRQSRLETALERALRLGTESAVRGLSRELAGVAPGSQLLAAGRRWLAGREARRREIEELRAALHQAIYEGRRPQVERGARRLEELLGSDAGGDAALAVAETWLAEQRLVAERRRQEKRRTSLKLLLTGAPLVLATLLCGLLLVVMAWGAG